MILMIQSVAGFHNVCRIRFIRNPIYCTNGNWTNNIYIYVKAGERTCYRLISVQRRYQRRKNKPYKGTIFAGAREPGGGGKGAIAPPQLFVSMGWICLCPPPKFGQSLGISTFCPPKKKIVPAPLHIW